MIHNHERLLVKLIEQYYGLVPSLTAQVLIHHGSILFKRALGNAKLGKTDFKRGLDILVRCNLVKVTLIKRQQLIEINTERVVHLLYYPHYLAIVQERFGVESVCLLKTMIMYGNLTVEELIEQTLLRIIEVQELELEDEHIKTFISSLFDNFTKLCSKRVIVPVDKKNTCPDKCNVDVVFKAIKDRFANNDPRSGAKTGSRGKPLCTFDCDVLNFLLFIELFPSFANQPFVNEEASYLFKLLLELTFDKSFSMKKTPLVYQEIYAQYSAKFPDVKMSRLSTILNMFSHFFAPNFIHVEKTGCSLDFGVFLLDMVKIVTKEFVKKNFGENAVRIFGALLEDPCVFENNLLNSLKIDSKELHRNLYQLDLNRMINITYYSEANQSSSTILARNIKKAFSVELKEVVAYILNRCYYSLYSIMHRRHIELDDQKELIKRKTMIENFKKQVAEMEDLADREEVIKNTHNYMSEADHTKAERLLSYDSKVDKVDYHLINYVFILNMWKIVNDESERNRLDSPL